MRKQVLMPLIILILLFFLSCFVCVLTFEVKKLKERPPQIQTITRVYIHIPSFIHNINSLDSVDAVWIKGKMDSVTVELVVKGEKW